MKSRFDAALRAASGVLPATLAAVGSTSTALAAHDDGVVRTIGAGFTGVFRSLDLLIAAPMLLVPIGTRALRAGLASAIVTGICGIVAFDLARALVSVAVPAAVTRAGVKSSTTATTSPRLLSAVAAVAVLSALMSPTWQMEASAPGGSVIGALIILLALRATVGEEDVSLATSSPSPLMSRLPQLALLLGLAASYEPLTFVAALAVIAPAVVLSRSRDRKKKKTKKSAPAARVDQGEAMPRDDDDDARDRDRDRHRRSDLIHAASAFALGLAPLGLGFALMRRAPEIALHVPPVRLVDPPLRMVSLPVFALGELGTILLLVCGGGLATSLFVPGTRRLAAALTLVVGVAALAIVAFHVPAGPSRFASPVLAGVACAFILGATMLGALVVAISRARVPFAEASAALVVVLELVLPIKALDDTSTRRDARVTNAAAIWNDIAWGAAPPASVILVADRATMRRIASARAAGDMRGDLVIVPSFDVQGSEGQHALVAEPKLAPLYRDMALGVPPEELSFAQLGTQRAVLASFDPKWDRALSRHLVPIGLTSRFEPEPRGASDRKHALDVFTPSKDRLVRIAVAKKDPELAVATATLLRARAIGMAATGERDILSRALDDLRSFAPDDPIGATLVRRIVTSKGPIDVHDLSP